MKGKTLVPYTVGIASLSFMTGAVLTHEAWRIWVISRKAMLALIVDELIEKARDEDLSNEELGQWIDKQLAAYNYPLDKRAKKV